MANPLDLLGRAMLQISGMTPQQIREKTRANKTPKPMPKPKASKPAPKPTPKPIEPVGQTNLFNAKGNVRDFRNPNVSVNRSPTLSPVQAGGTQTLNPGPVRPAPPGQMSIFGTNPSATPSGNFTAPTIPKPGQGVDPTKWLRQLADQRAADAAAARAVRAQNYSNGVMGGLPALQLILQAANMVQDATMSKDDRAVKDANSISKANMFAGDFQTREQVLGARQKPYSSVANRPVGTKAVLNGQPVMWDGYKYIPDNSAWYGPGGRDSGVPAPAPAPAPAAGPAPSPQQQPSVYAPRATEAPRPNRPMPAQPAAPAAKVNPYAGIGDVRGNEMGTAPSGSIGVDQQNLSAPRTVGDTDYERRRAFLDADNSLDGMRAVRDLLKRRKLSISVSD